MKTRLLAILSTVSMVASLLVVAPLPAAATEHIFEISLWGDFVDANGESGDGVQLAAGLYILTDTIEVPSGAVLEGPEGQAWEPGPDGSTLPLLTLCDPSDNTLVRTAATICAVPDGPQGFTAFSIGAGASATIESLTIAGADTRSDGGAIYVAEGGSLNLVDSFIYGNSAGEGGGLFNLGDSSIDGSTFSENSASGKGGAVNNSGTLSVLNSTFTMNIAKQGAAFSMSSDGTMSFVTIVENLSTNKTGAATHENGGTASIKNSIIANNRGGDGSFHDCSGSPTLNGVLLSSSQGCNPKGTGNLVIETIAFDPLADNGGPTQTIKLPAADHPAVELAVDCKDVGLATIDEDQRNIGRPQPEDGECDSGAYELGDASISATLTAPLEVSAGAVTAPLSEITLAIQQAASTGTSVQGTPLSAIPLSAITIADAPLSTPLSAIDTSPEAVPLSAIPLSAIPLSAIPLSAIPLSAIPLSAIPLSAITIADAPLSAIDSVLLSDLSRTDGGSLDDFLLGSIYEGWPLLSLTFADLVAIPLTSEYISEVSLSSTPLSAIPLSAIPLSAIGDVTNTDCSSVDCDATTLGDISPLPGAELGDVIGLDDVNLQSTPLSAIPLSAIALGTLPLSAIPLSAIDSSENELSGLDAWCAYIGASVCAELGITSSDDSGNTLVSIAVEGVPLSAIPLSAIPLSAIPLSAIPLSAIPLSAITWESTPLSAIPLSAIELSGVPLSAICTDPVACVGLTLGTVDDFADGASIGLLDAVVDGYDYVLWDLLFGLFGPQDIPWALAEDLNAIRLPAADNDPLLAFDYVVGFTLSESNAQVAVELTLPLGFVPVDGSGFLEDDLGNSLATLLGNETQAPSESNVPISLRFDAGDLAPATYVLRVPNWAGVDLGEFDATVDVTASAATTSLASDTTTVTVVEPSERERFLTSGNLEIAHVSTVGKTEIFKLEIPGDIEGASVKLLLSNLSADLDLVLFGPPATSYLRGTPLPGFGAIEDHRYDLNPDDDILDADVLRDVNVDAQKLGLPPTFVPIAVSANRDLANEEIEARIPTDGPYYAVVSGYNGASSNSAFALQGRFLGNSIACEAVDFGWTPADTYPQVTTPEGLNTLILYNRGRLQTGSDLLAYLDEFADTDPDTDEGPDQLGAGVVAMAVPIDAPSAAQIELGFWYSAAGRCDPEAANNVVRVIGSSILDFYPNVDNVVIVGDDSHVPFARLVDRVNLSNETEFGATLPSEASPELRSALAGGYYFSDDPYGSKPGVKFADGEFFVPTIAVGRLLETPEQILAQFTAFTGVLAGNEEAAVSGYDFLTDGAEAVKTGLEGLDLQVDALISETWSRDNLVSQLSKDLSVASVNAHFDQYRALPALGNSTRNETDLFTVEDLGTIVAAPSNIFDSDALLFSMGCHSGLSVSNIQLAGEAPEWAQDWAEEVTGLGAVWVANSGYGYGDSQVVAYSESISANFAQYLDSMSAGQAWVRAKQQFASGLLSVSPYHTKAMNEFIFYGLPMVKTSTAASAPPPEFPDDGTGPAPAADTTGVGLPVATVTASTGLTAQPSGGPTSYYVGNGGTLEVRGRAITALGEFDVTRPDGAGGLADEAVGVVITGLSSSEEQNFSPLFFNPISGYSVTEDRPFVLDSTFPAGLARLVTYVDEDGQTRQKIVFAATRFRPNPSDGEIGTLIKYEDFTADVYYRSGTALDQTPPLIQLVDGVSDGEIAYFQIEVDGDDHEFPDSNDPVDDTRRVNVLFAPSSGSNLEWQTVELVRVAGSNRWVGGAPINESFSGTSFSFWVQACDAFGNCGASTAKGIDFLTAEADIGVSLLPTGELGNLGWYLSAVSVLASSDSDLVEYRLDGGEPVLLPQSSNEEIIPIPTDGVHYLVVYDEDGNVGGLLVAIDTVAPEVTVTLDPETGWVGANGAEVTLEAADAGSGVLALQYRLEGDTAFLPYPSSGLGEVTANVEFLAADRAGNETTGTIEIQYDNRPPIVEATAPVAPTTWTNQDVTVTITATDGGEAGIDWFTYTTDGSQPTAENGNQCDVEEGDTCTDPYLVLVELTGTQQTDVTYAAADLVDNVGSGSYSVWIDQTSPTASALGVPESLALLSQPPTVSFSCSDEHSGPDTCQATITRGPEAVASSTSETIVLPTDTAGDFTLTVTATDKVGNTTELVYSYSVVDDEPPVIEVLTPQEGAFYEKGQLVTVSFTCTDNSGVDPTCDAVIAETGTAVADGSTLPTEAVGSFTLIVTSSDGTNESVQTVTYTVGYGICLLYDPLREQPATGAVAIKLQICDADGVNLSKANTTVTATSLAAIDAEGEEVPLELDPQDSGQSNSQPTLEFRYDAKLKGYIYNLNQDPPLAVGSYVLHFTVKGTEPHEYSAAFALK